jgi:hypothetical protein
VVINVAVVVIVVFEPVVNGLREGDDVVDCLETVVVRVVDCDCYMRIV